jgi:hypothetical protein
LDRNGLSVSTETACRFEPKSPVGNSEICKQTEQGATIAPGVEHFDSLFFSGNRQVTSHVDRLSSSDAQSVKSRATVAVCSIEAWSIRESIGSSSMRD